MLRKVHKEESWGEGGCQEVAAGDPQGTESEREAGQPFADFSMESPGTFCYWGECTHEQCVHMRAYVCVFTI